MAGAFFRIGILAVPLALGAYAGCSSSDATSDAAADAGTDTAAPTPPPPPPPPPPAPVDAAPARDCTADLDTDGIPKHLDCTGIDDPSVKPYKPGVEFWSDGAEKRRLLYLPPVTTIDISNFDEWKFPVGTKAWKEFKVDGKLVETRMYWKKTATDPWKHAVYRWNATGTEATRLETGELVPRDGGVPYEVPSNGVCIGCHAGHDEPLLGVEAVSLAHSDATGWTLAKLATDGRLSAAPPATSLTIPDDGTGKLAGALGWLHINCGPCHTSNPNGGANFTGLRFAVQAQQLVADAGATSLDVYGTAVCKKSLRTDDAGATYVRIKGGAPAESLVSTLSGSRTPDGGDPVPLYQMPPLVTRIVDTNGHAKLDEWISLLPSCPP